LIQDPCQGLVALARAQAAVQRAEVLLVLHPEAGDAAKERRLRELKAELHELEKDRRLLERLEEIRLGQAAGARGEAGRAYEQAFREVGVAGAKKDIDAVAARLRRSPVRDAAIAALDDWMRLAAKDSPEVREWLQDLVRAADPDPWRNRLREAVARKDRAALQKLAGEPDVGQQRSATICLLANSLRESGAAAGAIALLRRAQRQYPGDFWINVQLAQALAVHGPPRVEEALRFYTAALALRPESAEVHLALAHALRDKGELDEAVTAYQEALRLRPDLSVAYVGLGDVLAAKCPASDAAIAAYRRAIQLQPDFAVAHRQLGIVLRNKGMPQEAVAALRRAIELQPGLIGAFTQLGHALADQGKLDEALECYRTALRSDPPDRCAEPCFGLGRVLRQKGRPEEAAFAFRQALRFRPDWPECRAILGDALKDAGQPLAAVDEYQKAFAARPLLADDLRAAHRYRAACAAAGAVGGVAKDAGQLSEKDRTRLRGQALQWLRSDLARWMIQLKSGKPEDREAAQGRLRHWQRDPDLTGLRDAEALKKLPADEQEVCRKLWADVAALLGKANEAK
jgi:tetratricopeptide (TPR) repeat protein